MTIFAKRDRTAQEPPMLWIGVLAGSLVLHLAVLLIGRWYFSRTMSSPASGTPNAIEFVEIDPTATAPSRSVAPSQSANSQPLPKSPSNTTSPQQAAPTQPQPTQPAPPLEDSTIASRIEAPPKPRPTVKPQQERPLRSQPPKQTNPITPPTQPDSQTTTSQTPAPPTNPPNPPNSTPPNPTNPDNSNSGNSSTLPESGSPGSEAPSNPADPNSPGQSGTPLPPPIFGGDQNPEAPGQSPTAGNPPPVNPDQGSGVRGVSVALGAGMQADVPERPDQLAQPLESSRTIEVTSLPASCSVSSEVINNSGREVILRLTISEAGDVEGDPLVISGSGTPDYAALAKCVIRDWKFSPAYNIKDGQREVVPSNLDIPVRIQVANQ